MKEKKVKKKETRFRIIISTEKPVMKVFNYTSIIEASTLEKAFSEATIKAKAMQNTDPESKYYITYVSLI